MNNSKTASEAENAFSIELKKRGHTIIGQRFPVDLTSEYKGKKYYWEIKSTKGNGTNQYYGSVSLNQLNVAQSKKKQFKFVFMSKMKNKWIINEYNLNEFVKFIKPGTIRITFATPPAKTTKYRPINLKRLRELLLFMNSFISK